MTNWWWGSIWILLICGCDSASESDPSPFIVPPSSEFMADSGFSSDVAVADVIAVDAMPQNDQGLPSGTETFVPGSLCANCNSDTDCEIGGLCLTNQNTNERFCGAPCNSSEDCPRGAGCFDISETTKQCAPFGGSCRGFPPSDLGGTCEGAADCQNGATECLQIADRAFCTVECSSNDDCPTGLKTCMENRCIADWTVGPEGCGRLAVGPITNCDENGACPSGQSCLTDLMDDYPERLGALCAVSCSEETICPENTRCADVGDGQTFCLPKRCECLARPVDESLLDTTLALVGMHRCDVGITDEVLHRFPWSMAQDPYRLPFFNAIYQDAYGGYRWARTWRRNLASEVLENGAAGVIGLASRTAGINADISEPPADETQTLPMLIGALHQTANVDFRDGEIQGAIANLPSVLQSKMVRILAAQLRVIQVRQEIDESANLSNGFLESLYPHLLSALSTRPDFVGLNLTNREMRRLTNDDYDYGRVILAGARLSAIIEGTDWRGIVNTALQTIRIDTPYGPIVIQGNADDELVEGETPLLLIDTGGDDRYLIPTATTTSPYHPVSVSIDLDGNDIYGFEGSDSEGLYPPLAKADAAGRYDGSHPQIGDAIGPMSLSDTSRQGAGILGVGILYDAAGDDQYLSHKVSQGAGIFGMGVLIDKAGSDTYTCEQGCQGAGAFGLGLLMDRSGGDRYIGVQYVQGYGYIKGIGILHDGEGNDHYEAILGDPAFGGVVRIYPSAQNEQSNASFSQGAGFGRRVADSASVFASGGLGSLVDEGMGNDVYRADIFAQATGYWFSTGILADGGGDDVYQGRWYVQGSTAHYALSYFFEEGGDDLYNPMDVIMATAVGQGHDLSHGWLVDYSGNDEYFAPSLGLGGGNDNGIGFFIEVDGDDTYHAPDGTTYGGSNIGDRGELFDTTLSLGIFIDANGTDQYNDDLIPSGIGQSTSWQWQTRRENTKPGDRGAGVDTENGQVILP